MCEARKARSIVECEICGHQLSETELEGVIEISFVQAKLMAQAVSETSDLSADEIISRWKSMGFVNTRELLCSL